MKVNKAYKLRIYPNKLQKVLIEKTFGSVRFLYNSVLAYKKDLYTSTGRNYSKFDAMKDVTEIKKIPDYEWLKEVDSIALQQSLVDLDVAYTNFFKHHKSFPKFKKKNDKNSFRTQNVNSNISVSIETKRIKLPKIGSVKFKDTRTIEGEIKNATVSRNPSNQYFVSVLVEYDFEPKLPTNINESDVFSADMSAKSFMVSGEMEFENQKFYRSNLRRLQIRQRKLSKKTKGSNNRQKAKHIVTSIHRDITNKRRGFQRNLANTLVRQFDVLIFEDLNINAMKQFNSGLSKTVSMDFSWTEFLGFIQWKAFKENKHFVKISRWFPSSKMCNVCGSIKEDLTLDDRIYKCDCGNVDDRDLNAAKNIKAVGLDQLLNSFKGINLLKNSTGLMPESYACGDMSKVTNSAQESTSFR